MSRILTLPERKAKEARRKREAVALLRDKLRSYAMSKGGRFILFGSAARDALRHDSDVDILVDFPEAKTADAWRFAEDACARLSLPSDVKPVAYCDPSFLTHISDSCEILG